MYNGFNYDGITYWKNLKRSELIQLIPNFINMSCIVVSCIDANADILLLFESICSSFVPDFKIII